jgi:hypothetical protein
MERTKRGRARRAKRKAALQEQRRKSRRSKKHQSSLRANSEAETGEPKEVAEDDIADDMDDDERLEEILEREAKEREESEEAQAKALKTILKCRKKNRQARKGQRELLYEVYANLYRASSAMSRDPHTVRSFIHSQEVTECTARMPGSSDGNEWAVFAVRFAFWGASKSRQKEASKYAAVTEFLLNQRVHPEHVSELLKKYTIRRLAEMSARRRQQEELIDESLRPETLEGEALPPLDQPDVAEEYREIGLPAAVLVAVPQTTGGQNEPTDADRGVRPETIRIVPPEPDAETRRSDQQGYHSSAAPWRPASSSTIMVRLSTEVLELLRSVQNGREAFLQLRKHDGVLIGIGARKISQKM